MLELSHHTIILDSCKGIAGRSCRFFRPVNAVHGVYPQLTRNVTHSIIIFSAATWYLHYIPWENNSKSWNVVDRLLISKYRHMHLPKNFKGSRWLPWFLYHTWIHFLQIALLTNVQCLWDIDVVVAYDVADKLALFQQQFLCSDKTALLIYLVVSFYVQSCCLIQTPDWRNNILTLLIKNLSSAMICTMCSVIGASTICPWELYIVHNANPFSVVIYPLYWSYLKMFQAINIRHKYMVPIIYTFSIHWRICAGKIWVMPFDIFSM